MNLKYLIQKFLWSINFDLSRINFDNILASEFIKPLRPIQLYDYQLKRFGNQDGDGGYIVPNNFDNIKYLFSLGAG